MLALVWAEIGRRVLIEAEIVAAAGVLAEVVVGDAGVADVLAVEGAVDGTVGVVVGGINTPTSAADFSR